MTKEVSTNALLMLAFVKNQRAAKKGIVHGYTCPEDHGPKEVLLFPTSERDGVLLRCPIRGCKYTQKLTEDMPLWGDEPLPDEEFKRLKDDDDDMDEEIARIFGPEYIP